MFVHCAVSSLVLLATWWRPSKAAETFSHRLRNKIGYQAVVFWRTFSLPILLIKQWGWRIWRLSRKKKLLQNRSFPPHSVYKVTAWWGCTACRTEYFISKPSTLKYFSKQSCGLYGCVVGLKVWKVPAISRDCCACVFTFIFSGICSKVAKRAS